MKPWLVPSSGPAAEIVARIAAAVPELATARLRLRAPRLADYAAFAEIATTARGVHIGGPMADREAWLDFVQIAAGWLLRGYGAWSVERRADGALLGFVILNHEHGDPEPELGYLFLPAAEGRSYAFEAAEAARRFAFETLGWSAVVSYVDPANARSIRLAERLGAAPDPATPHPEDASVLVFRHDRRPA